MNRKIPENQRWKFRGKTCDQYDSEMLASGENHFNSYGNYIELKPPIDDNDAVFAAKSLFALAIIGLRIAWWVLCTGAVIWFVWYAWTNIL